MVKQAALSVRILEWIKRDIDKAAAKEHRSTSSLVEKILDDHLRAAKTGAPRKYPAPNEYQGNLLEMPTPLGKPLGYLTSKDLKALAEAERLLARHHDKALNALKRELKRREKAL